MKSFFYIFLILIPVMFLYSCMGTITLNETARTVGDSQQEITAGFGYPFAETINYTYGLTKDLDIGIHVESIGAGLRTKYAILNEMDKGFSLAIAGGAGVTAYAYYLNGDLIASYLTEIFEPYTAIRSGYVKRKGDDSQYSFISNFLTTVGVPFFSSEYGYVQPILGSRIWINKNWQISFEGSYIFIIDNTQKIIKGFNTLNSYCFGVSFGYRTN